jgi:hypothetical protein
VLKLGDPLLLEVSRLTPVSGTERFAMALAMHDRVEPVLVFRASRGP